ncbi:MAG TPA: hypothetical protein VMU53_18190 [Candidatus Sulfotelmatobacter sp.]|nr:hypothetical protein [Candidatus Sulfotelmatobacter sp.]
MDLSKYPLDKLIYFIAAILPGAVALFIFQLALPGSFGWAFNLGFLGYKTRVVLVVLICFVVGYTITTALSRLLGAVGGAVGAVYVHLEKRDTPSVAPWRDARWRALVKTQLGANAPNDTHLMSETLFQMRAKMLGNLAEPQRQQSLIELQREKLATEIDDSSWQEWYDHYHEAVLLPSKRDFIWNVENGLNFNLQSASLYLLLSAIPVPAVRRWWYILPASIWVLLLLAEIYSQFTRFLDPWSTLSAQRRYLSTLVRSDKAADE